MELRAEILQAKLWEFFNAASYCGDKIELLIEKGGIGFSQVCLNDRELLATDLFSEEFTKYHLTSKSNENSVCLSLRPILTALSMVMDDEHIKLKINRRGLWLKSEHMNHYMGLAEDVIPKIDHLPLDYLAQVRVDVNRFHKLLAGIQSEDTLAFTTNQDVFSIRCGGVEENFSTEAETGFKVFVMGAGGKTNSRYRIKDVMHFLEAFPDNDAVIYLGKQNHPLLFEVVMKTIVLRYYLSPTGTEN